MNVGFGCYFSDLFYLFKIIKINVEIEIFGDEKIYFVFLYIRVILCIGKFSFYYNVFFLEWNEKC